MVAGVCMRATCAAIAADGRWHSHPVCGSLGISTGYDGVEEDILSSKEATSRCDGHIMVST